MSEENNEITEGHSDYKPADSHNESIKHQLTGMYQNWFLDYASYVILERAVPHINDGLKPVQRRILHSMKRMDDGRYNKVANIVGHTMQFHPHGDASIGDALVQLGQKDLLVDCQGNWGNILTGDGAAAPRYIEARLSKFALDVVFNPKTTEWKLSYDGRNKEPITLPVKFPLLLAVEPLSAGGRTELGVGADGVEGLPAALAHQCIRFTRHDLPLGNLFLAFLLPQILFMIADALLTALFFGCQFLRGRLRHGNIEFADELEINLNLLDALAGAAVGRMNHDLLHKRGDPRRGLF